MGHPLVVTVIPNWNLKEDLLECLDSLLKSSYIDQLIVVVDNGSTDGSPDLIAARYPQVHLIRLAENRGYAAALNVGLEYGLSQNAAYLFALNNDTLLNPDTLDCLVKTLESDPTIGVVTPKILYNAQRDRIYSLGERCFRFMPVPISYGFRWKDSPQYHGIMDFDYVTGCAMLIRADIIRQVGLFNISYFMYYEDADFCHRVRDQGYRIVVQADTLLYHKAYLSTSRDKPLITRIRARNRVHFYRRYPHGPLPLLTHITIVAAGIWRTGLYLLKGRKDLIKPYWQGLLDGWRQPVPPARYQWNPGGNP